ncbi:MAG: hypothetical protein K6E72_04210 [Saccharofermentans sp.]|jgi:TRAP-type uncharacterized transport system fused permease subunit|nr:hypothetical protein [Clostridiales bacterium]MCR5383832.1 hypothetical protein [Saccharofermentans sp.]
MVLSIISIIVNVLIFVVMNLNLYTDRAVMSDGLEREWQRSPLESLNTADKTWLFYIQIIVSAISIITSILLLAGVKNNVVKTIQMISTAASVIVFVIIMVVATTTHPKY